MNGLEVREQVLLALMNKKMNSCGSNSAKGLIEFAEAIVDYILDQEYGSSERIKWNEVELRLRITIGVMSNVLTSDGWCLHSADDVVDLSRALVFFIQNKEFDNCESCGVPLVWYEGGKVYGCSGCLGVKRHQ